VNLADMVTALMQGQISKAGRSDVRRGHTTRASQTDSLHRSERLGVVWVLLDEGGSHSEEVVRRRRADDVNIAGDLAGLL
jgi:hypothetical protein